MKSGSPYYPNTPNFKKPVKDVPQWCAKCKEEFWYNGGYDVVAFKGANRRARLHLCNKHAEEFIAEHKFSIIKSGEK